MRCAVRVARCTRHVTRPQVLWFDAALNSLAGTGVRDRVGRELERLGLGGGDEQQRAKEAQRKEEQRAAKLKVQGVSVAEIARRADRPAGKLAMCYELQAPS